MILWRRTAAARFSEIQRLWQGETVVLLGGGPSLTLAQVDRVGQAHGAGFVRCIAVNDAYLLAPWADVLYFADLAWFKWHADGIPKPVLGMTAGQVRERFAVFRGQKCTIQQYNDRTPDDPAVHVMRNRDHPAHGEGLSGNADELVTGRNSGFQAFNLAVLAGATQIILLGYDGWVPDGAMMNFHGEHPAPTHPGVWEAIRHSFLVAAPDLVALDVRVMNCSPTSVLGFERMMLNEALAQ